MPVSPREFDLMGTPSGSVQNAVVARSFKVQEVMLAISLYIH